MTDTIKTGTPTPRSLESIINRGILEEHAIELGKYNRLNNYHIYKNQKN